MSTRYCAFVVNNYFSITMLKFDPRYLCAFFLTLAWIYSYAQAPTQPSLLWKVEGKNLPSPSYLYGTIHLICPADFAMSDTLKACLKQTRQLTLEIDMDDPGMMMAMARSMTMQDNKQLKDLVSQPEYERLTAYFKDSVGVNIAPFSRAKPFMLMSILLNRVLTCQPQSYELSLMRMAQQQQVEVVGLETIEEQMAVFDSIPYTDQARMVVALMDSMPQARREFGKMVDLYKQQNLQKLYAMTLKSEFELENQQELLLNQRNRKWIPLLEKQMAEKPTFVAVGAAHLAGEQGVIALLRKQGYTLTPILAR